MKKYKIRAINSYASYKDRKEKVIKSLFVILAGAVIFVGTFLSGQLETDVKAFIAENKNNVSKKVYPPSKDVILAKGTVSYDLYMVPKATKGIYLSAACAQNIEEYIKLAKKTEVNTFVIDVKNDNGNLTFATDNEALLEKGIVLAHPPIEDIDQLIERMDEAGIYPIARVVVFKDNVYTQKYPEQAIKDLNNVPYVTSGGDRWLNPYDRKNWDYILEVCKEAHKHGFKEVEFDYVRFHESMSGDKVLFDGNSSKTQIITEFVKYMYEQLHAEGMVVSADVFGTVILSDIDAEIVGQDFTQMSRYLDYISPMVYPSHYAEGTFGVQYPHLQPYEIILNTLKIGEKKLSAQEGHIAQFRPWLQDFTLSYKKPYLEYGPKELKEQIRGAADGGVDNWLFWNAAGKYTVQGLTGE